MQYSNSAPIYFAKTNHRGGGVRFGIRNEDRLSHMLVIGKTGTGKSTLLRTMIIQDIERGHGCALLDPHGDLFGEVALSVPLNRSDKCIRFDVTEPSLAWRFNPLSRTTNGSRALAVAGLVEVFKKLWPDEWGPRLEHLLRNVVFTLLERPDSTLADIPPLLSDRTFRFEVLSDVQDPVINSFWRDEYDRYSPAFRAVVTAPLQNKLGAMLTDPLLRRILTEPGKQLDFQRILDEGQILLVNLDKGSIGEGPSALVGSLILSQIAFAGLRRSGQRPTERREFFVFCDEYQTFTTLSLATMLSELRKYRVGLTLAQQHLSQVEPRIRDAVLGNAGSLLAFRVSAQDAATLGREFAPVFSPEDLISLPLHHICIRLLIGGEASRPFSATTASQVPRSLDTPATRTQLGESTSLT